MWNVVILSFTYIVKVKTSHRMPCLNGFQVSENRGHTYRVSGPKDQIASFAFIPL